MRLARSPVRGRALSRKLTPTASNQAWHWDAHRDQRHSPASRPAIDPGWSLRVIAQPSATDRVAAQLEWSVRDGMIGPPTKHYHGGVNTVTGQHEPALSRKRWSLRSLVVDLGHAKQAQEPALELAQLGLEDQGTSSPPNAERVP